MTQNLPPLREVIATHNLRADKSLGQNFLLDQNITDKIVRDTGDITGHHVIEIGPGPGGLTRSILQAGAKRVTAIEFDERAVAALQDLKSVYPNLDIIHADALKFDPRTVSDDPKMIIANLPYNIATPLLIKWLEHIHNDPTAYTTMALMFQKEVANRITATAGTKPYGRLSIITGWLTNAHIIYDLPPTAFTPPPKVNSSVVRFTPKSLTQKPDFKIMEKITAAAFGQRRKMIRSSLKDYTEAIEKTDIPPTLRAENLTIEDFVNLADATTNN